MKVDINVTKVYDWLEQSKARINILRGGTGSSKSYSLSQYFAVNKFCGEGRRTFVIARKTLPALKKTAYKETMDIVDSLGIPYKLNKTDLELRVKDNICYFMSLDDPHKVASFQTDDVWLEEMIDFTFEDFHQFNMRMNGQMYGSFNPVSALHWIKTILIDSGNYDIGENVSTYRDNPYLAVSRRKEIENLIKVDQNFYKIYNLGEWGVLENIIYGNWKTFKNVKIDKETKVKTIDGKKVDDITYGLDFGYEHPSCLTEINWVENDFIVHELLYQSKLTNTELIERVKELIPEDVRYREIFADHSEPARINEFYQADFNIHRAKKDVLPGIDYCKTHFLGVTAESINGIKELQSYKRREDKDGNVMEEPVKASVIRDDFCDSFRYGAYSKFDVTGESKLADFSFR